MKPIAVDLTTISIWSLYICSMFGVEREEFDRNHGLFPRMPVFSKVKVILFLRQDSYNQARLSIS